MIATVQVSCWSAQLRDYHSHNHENRHQILGGRNIRQSLSKYFGSHDRAMVNTVSAGLCYVVAVGNSIE